MAILAVGNAGGRIAAGYVSDRIGRGRTLALVFIIQALLMLAAILSSAPRPPLPARRSSRHLIGFNYGANLALFPSFTKDLWA